MCKRNIKNSNNEREWVLPFIYYALGLVIGQAGRAQQLEGLIKSHAPDGLNYTNVQYIELLQENKRLCEAIDQALAKHKWKSEESARILENALEVSR